MCFFAGFLFVVLSDLFVPSLKVVSGVRTGEGFRPFIRWQEEEEPKGGEKGGGRHPLSTFSSGKDIEFSTLRKPRFCWRLNMLMISIVKIKTKNTKSVT